MAAFYRDAFVALVTPLRDGMNLVAKEFVACQINETGVLILSPFAGAGGTMREALLINPYEVDGVAETIHKALCMDVDERRWRMQQLRKREADMDVNQWFAALSSISFFVSNFLPFLSIDAGCLVSSLKSIESIAT